MVDNYSSQITFSAENVHKLIFCSHGNKFFIRTVYVNLKVIEKKKLIY